MTHAGSRSPLLVIDRITKTYPGVKALDQVGFSLMPGEVHGLVGENGAGKSTLVRVLGGLEAPDAGTLLLGDEPYAPRTPQDALRRGVRVVHQELNALANLTVAENLFMDHLPRRAGFVRRRELNAKTADVLAEVGLDLPPTQTMATLSLAQIQLVEIARALTQQARLVILDEPTATLTPPERDRLLDIIRDLKRRGVGVIFISHHLDEVFQICDRATVLRNGRLIATRPVAELTPRDMVQMMVGRELADDEQFPADAAVGDVLLDVRDLVVPGLPEPISFHVRRGEILGVAGLVGAGRSETMRALFGADRPGGGSVTVNGRPVRIRRPRDAVAAGISFATEDRKHQGLVLPMSVAVNITMAAIDKVSRFGWLAKRREAVEAAAVAARMRVKTTSVAAIVGTLSGGNQQKVVLSRWLFRDSEVLIVDEPTRGIDVGARREIYGLLADLARQGKGIIMVSSDLGELTAIAHRIAVFSRGELVAQLPRDQFSQEAILTHAYSNFSQDLRAGAAATEHTS